MRVEIVGIQARIYPETIGDPRYQTKPQQENEMPGPGAPAGGHTAASAISEAEYWRELAEARGTALRAGYDMRQAQMAYFDSRSSTDLVAAKIAEKKFDALVEPMFGRQGALKL